MDITQRRAWRACGWAAAGLYTCILAVVIGDAIGTHAPRALDTLAICTAPAATLLAAVRLFAPLLVKLDQKFDVKIGIDRHVAEASRTERRDSGILRLVPPLPTADPRTVHGCTYTAKHRYDKAASE